MVVISAVFMLSGCRSAMHLFWNQPKQAATLYGTYTADYNFAKETLTLSPDGTYVQQVTLKSEGRVNLVRGTWRYDPATAYVTFDHHMMLVMDGFQHFRPGYAEPRSKGLVSLPADRLFGQIRIGGTDEGVLYYKQ